MSDTVSTRRTYVGGEGYLRAVPRVSLSLSPVVVEAALHSRVGLNAADEVARRAEQG